MGQKCKGCMGTYLLADGYCKDCNRKNMNVMRDDTVDPRVLLLLGLVVVIGLVIWFFVAFSDAILTAMGAIGLIAIGICVLLVPFVLAALLFKAGK